MLRTRAGSLCWCSLWTTLEVNVDVIQISEIRYMSIFTLWEQSYKCANRILLDNASKKNILFFFVTGFFCVTALAVLELAL